MGARVPAAFQGKAAGMPNQQEELAGPPAKQRRGHPQAPGSQDETQQQDQQREKQNHERKQQEYPRK